MHICTYVYVYMYVYICIYVYVYICMYVHMYTYICIRRCSRAGNTRPPEYAYMYICIYAYMYVCIMRICIYAHIHMYSCVCVFACVWALLPEMTRPRWHYTTIYKHTHTHTHTHTHAHTLIRTAFVAISLDLGGSREVGAYLSLHVIDEIH